MATIYRFIVEQKTTAAGSGRTARTSTGKGAGKKGKMVSIFGGEKGGVEHNRKLRAINPLINRVTNGWWEKGMRIGRAAGGLVKVNTATGKLGISGAALAILIAFAIQCCMTILEREQQKAQKLNAQNFKQLENGVGALHGQYKVSTNFWTGRHTYNQNK